MTSTCGLSRAQRRHKLSEIKLAAGCMDCGYNKHSAALDFDHVRGTKSFNISRSDRPWEVVLAEVKKCDVRCANCHRARHH